MDEASAKPAVLLGVRIPDEFVQRLASRYAVLGPLPPPFSESVAALPVADAQRVRVLITMGSVSTTGAALAHLPALALSVASAAVTKAWTSPQRASARSP